MASYFENDMPYLEETDSRKRNLFYSENTLELIADFFKNFEQFLDAIQIYNKFVQGTPIPHHRVLFFIERTSKGLYDKWHLFFNTCSNITLLMKLVIYYIKVFLMLG